MFCRAFEWNGLGTEYHVPDYVFHSQGQTRSDVYMSVYCLYCNQTARPNSANLHPSVHNLHYSLALNHRQFI